MIGQYVPIRGEIPCNTDKHLKVGKAITSFETVNTFLGQNRGIGGKEWQFYPQYRLRGTICFLFCFCF